jgi:putative ABC transport system ATP-binding protein
MNTSLEITGVSYTLSRTLLDGIDLAFPPGELTAVSGPSGSGKTTLLSIAGGLIEPTTGSASYAGRPMWQGTGDPRPEVAFVLQVYGLIPILSAQENVSVALRARGVDPREADERAQAALARFHIADLGDRQVEELSGGQMQRVACARGFVVGADILLADEPTSELDELNRGMVLAELRQDALRGAIVVVATHDPAVVDACDRHYVLDDGRLTDHVAEVDLSVWGRRQPVERPFETPPTTFPPVADAPPEPVELVDGRSEPVDVTPASKRAASTKKERGDDSIFRRPRSRPK